VNTIERTYRMRGTQVHLQEVVDLAAVRSASTGRPRVLTAAAVGAIAPEAESQVRAFESAGWEFVPRHQAADGAKVYLKSGGRVALGTNRLTVRVAGECSDKEAAELLACHGFAVVDRLKFAPNLFVVEVASGRDAIEAAERLAASGEVEFAEPELIEVIPRR